MSSALARSAPTVGLIWPMWIFIAWKNYHCAVMSDDFGTVNVRRGDRAREIEVLRQHYRGHRDALSRLAADAPTEQLAAEYNRLIAGIDDALRKLDELEGRPTTQPGSRPVP